jgi:hypothetical protein
LRAPDAHNQTSLLQIQLPQASEFAVHPINRTPYERRDLNSRRAL